MRKGPRTTSVGPVVFLQAEDDRERRARTTAGAREEAPGVPARGGCLEQPARERVAGRGRALELHPLAHGGDVAAAHTRGGAEAVSPGATACGAGRRGAGVHGSGHDRVLPLSAGKIATTDVMDCYWCDWSDAPDGMDGCYRPVTIAASVPARTAVATVRACCASG